MNGDSAFQTQPAYVQKTSNRKRLVTIFLVVLVLIIAALGALYLLGSSAKHPTPQPTTPIPTETIAATPTPATNSAQLTPTGAAITTTPTASAGSLSVSVLNGSGTPGAAGQTATALKSAGFTNVTTGNASVYTYTGITIHVKKKENLAAVEKAIASVNPNAKITSGVDPTLPTDVEVIVGK